MVEGGAAQEGPGQVSAAAREHLRAVNCSFQELCVAILVECTPAAVAVRGSIIPSSATLPISFFAILVWFGPHDNNAAAV